LINKDGVNKTECKSIVLACGCRERTSRQIGIHGRHSAGVFTAGTAQYYTNILGKMPAKRCIILGSGDIGLIMARRLKLEGAEVLGVYEAKPTASGLMRNVYQCLEDFDIPLYTCKTITRIFGEGRINAVEVSSVDENMKPLPGTEQIIECDALIISVGLIPENELAESIGVPIDTRTRGPVTDQNYMTMIDGVFCCGNAQHVNDLVDYVSESGETAGQAAAQWAISQQDVNKVYPAEARSFAEVYADESLMYVVPRKLNLAKNFSPVIFYFRSGKERSETNLIVKLDGEVVFTKKYLCLRPPEMERLKLDFHNMKIDNGSRIDFSLSEPV
jgi:thioredoxin reductase